MKQLYSTIFNKKTPLVLLVAGQAVTLYQWQMHTYSDAPFMHTWATFLISIATAFALDGAIVQIAFAKKYTWVHWLISFLTSITFTALGIAIAIYTTEDMLHAAFSLGIFLYSWFIALVLNAEPNTLQPTMQYAREIQYPAPIAVEECNATQVVESNAMYHCPKCNAEVKPGSWYRVQKRGYCSKCK